MSSSFDVRVHFRVARQRYFKCECKCCALPCFIQSSFHFGFLPSKPCFSLKSVPLNLCYTEAYHLWIGSFPADRCDRLIKSKTGFSIAHPSAVKPESELRPKWCKVAFKWAFKLLFLKCIFEFMINTAPPRIENNAFSITILAKQLFSGCKVQWSRIQFHI